MRPSKRWYRLDFYLKFFYQFSRLTNNLKFMFIVPKHAENIVEIAFYSRKNVFIISPRLKEVDKYLSAVNFRLMFLNPSKIAVGTKIGQYLAASLPAIVSPNCIGAVVLIDTNPELGCVADFRLGNLYIKDGVGKDHLSSHDKLLHSKNNQFDFSENYFDNEMVSGIYNRQYRRLLDLV